MIETIAQREKRIKAETAERSERAARHAEVIARQNATMGLPATPVAAPLAIAGVSTFPTLTFDESKPLTVLTAKSLTAQIRRSMESAANLITTAHKLEAWKILGYDTWTAYCTKEFGVSVRRGYQLLEHVETVAEIEKGCEPGTLSSVNERQTRPMAGLSSSKKRTAWKRATKAAGGQPTAKQVKAEVDKMKPAKAKLIESIPAVVNEQGQQVIETTSALLMPSPKVCPHCGQPMP